MTKRYFHIDLETYSDLNLRSRSISVDAYARHPSTEVLIACLRPAGSGIEETLVWDITGKFANISKQKLVNILLDKNNIFSAWNDTFERRVLATFLANHVSKYRNSSLYIQILSEISNDLDLRFRDTADLAKTFSLPQSLDGASKAIFGKSTKDSAGSALITKFSKPRKQTKYDKRTRILPEEDLNSFRSFVTYCKMDVQTEMEIHQVLRQYSPHTEAAASTEDEIIRFQKIINTRGVPVDVKLTENLGRLSDIFEAKVLKELKSLTGLSNPNSRNQILGWLQERIEIDNLQAATLDQIIKDADVGETDIPEEAYKVIKLRRMAGGTARKKYKAFNVNTDPASRVIRDTMSYYSASRTGRFGGRLIQPQNLVADSLKPEEITKVNKGKAEGMDSVSMYDILRRGTRACIAPTDPDHVFLDVDYSSMENATLAWLADDEKALNIYRNRMDPYKMFASDMYRTPYDDISKEQRNIAKPAVLGCGFGLGPVGFQKYASGFGLDLTETEADDIVQAFRKSYPRIRAYTFELADHAIFATKYRRESGPFEFFKHPQTGTEMVIFHLPSGRGLVYQSPRVETQLAPWGDHVENFTYITSQGSQWVRTNSHGGKLVENATQAVARDLLVNGLLNAEKMEGIEVRFHVHDQIVATTHKDHADQKLDELVDAMTKLPRWAEGLPLFAEGQVAGRFGK